MLDVFISYRRKLSIDLAQRLKDQLSNDGYIPFIDLESMESGDFNEQLLKAIHRSRNFVVILAPGALDRCTEDSDWIRKEIKEALNTPGLNIIPLLVNGFRFPDHLPDDIARIANIQGVLFDSMTFPESYERMVMFLKDENGNPLSMMHDKPVSNTFYEQYPMTREEKERIKADAFVCRKMESEAFNRILAGKDHIFLFNPAVYEASSTVKKYLKHPEIGKTAGIISNAQDTIEANRDFGQEGKFRFYQGNMENADFEDLMDRIISENSISGFDCVDLTLILKDLSNPFEKLGQIVERMNDNSVMFVRELDDSMVLFYPDDNQYFSKAMEIFKHDRHAGSRRTGRQVYSLLKQAGAEKVQMVNRFVSTAGMSSKERSRLFQTYFSYLIPELEALRREDPDNLIYKEDLNWLKANYSKMQREFHSPDFFFLSGFLCFTAEFDTDDFEDEQD